MSKATVSRPRILPLMSTTARFAFPGRRSIARVDMLIVQRDKGWPAAARQPAQFPGNTHPSSISWPMITETVLGCRPVRRARSARLTG